MKNRTRALVIILIIITILVSGCMDILAKQKVGGFGDAQPNTSAGITDDGISGSTTTTSSFNGMQKGNIYTTCYKNCVQFGKEATTDDCDKGCCMAECQPRSPEDTERCAASCGVSLSKPSRVYA